MPNYSVKQLHTDSNLGDAVVGDYFVGQKSANPNITGTLNFAPTLSMDPSPTLAATLIVNGKSIKGDVNFIDGNNNTLFQLTGVASAVNYFVVNNAITGGIPTLSSAGADTNSNLKISAKGTGTIILQSTSNTPIQCRSGTSSLHTTNFTFINSANTRNISVPDVDGTMTLLGNTTTGTGTTLVLNNGPTFIAPILGTPASGTLTSCTGLPVSTGISGLGTGVATFLATPSSANLATAVTDETGTGSLVFGTSPTIATPRIAQINDVNGNAILNLTPVATAVNQLTAKNNIAGSYPSFMATGSDTNIGINFAAKGTGVMQFTSTNTVPFQIISGSLIHTTNFLFTNTNTTQNVTFPDATGTVLLTGQAISTVPSITFSSTSGIIGTTTNNDAAALSVGEETKSTIVQGSAVALTSATTANITSIALTAGDWDVYGHLVANPAASTTTSKIAVGIGSTTASMPALDTAGSILYTSALASNQLTLDIGPVRFSLASPTTIFLIANITFAVSTLGGYGTIRARRVR